MNLQNQLNLIYNDIDVDVRADTMRRPREGMTLNELLTELDEFKFDWWAKARKFQGGINQGQDSRVQLIIRQGPRYDQGGQPFDQYTNRQYQRSYQGFSYEQRSSYQNGPLRYQNTAYQTTQYSQFRQGYQSWQSTSYPNHQDYQGQGRYDQQSTQNLKSGQSLGQNQYSNGRALPSPTNRLQITSGPSGGASSSSGSQQRQPFRPLDNYNNQYRGNGNDSSNGNGYQSKTQRAYQINVIEDTELATNDIKMDDGIT